MAYTINRNSTSRQWEVSNNGVVIGSGPTPLLAINNAISTGGLPNDPELIFELLGLANNILNTESATTRLNNAGTGEPGTAGQGITATPDLEQRRANVQPATIDTNINQQPFDEVAGVDEAVRQQKQITINSAGIPVVGTDGNIVPGQFINPETNEIFYTEAGYAEGTSRSIDANRRNARSQAGIQDSTQSKARQDWRVRLSLAPNADYLYKSKTPGILSPLAATNGVIFPYTPNIQLSYVANYEPTTLTHSNYKIFQYNGSAVDNIQISCDFTAQDTKEANYLLAVIHFFRSVTKMFYGQDQNPKPGTPPPLCYLYGMGAFQFDTHPLVINNFNYSLPNNVDYIKANISYGIAGVNRGESGSKNNTNNPSENRLGEQLSPGGTQVPVRFENTPTGTVEPTYVPTKILIQINAYPIISRNEISNEFSLQKYATGQLLRGSKRAGGGIW